MGDDTIIIVPPEPTTEEEDTIEAIGEELLARLDEIDRQNGTLHARITELEGKLAELIAREFASVEHEHTGLAPAEHTHEHEHDGYALIKHEHQGPPPTTREPDTPPRKQHPYFRNLNEF